jgi:hypothetical protein
MPVCSFRRFAPASYRSRPALRRVSEAPPQPVVVILEVGEETGLQIKSPRYAGRYAGSVASHQIYEAAATGDPRPNRKELQDAIWWDGIAPLELQPHVNAILAIINSAKPADGGDDEDGE